MWPVFMSTPYLLGGGGGSGGETWFVKNKRKIHKIVK